MGSEGYCVIDPEEEWVASLRKKVEHAALRKHSRDNPPTIFRVPANMRKGDPGAYSPKVVSIGPYHRDNPALKATDGLKLRYLQKLLLRNPGIRLQDYIELIKGLEPEARASYYEDIDMDSDSFVEMMLFDGCFIVELFVMQLDEGRDARQRREEEYDDPNQTTLWTFPLVQYDLLMLENQIPYVVLSHIYHLLTTPPSYQGDYYFLYQLAHAFVNHHLPRERLVVPSEDVVPKYYHLLHFLHSCIMPKEHRKASQSEEAEKYGYKPFIYHKLTSKTERSPTALYRRLLPTPGSLPSATRLKEAGIVFKKKEKEAADSFLDVEFRDGVMEIPNLKVYDHTNYLFRNLIAFEQCFPRAGSYFVTYTMLMDCLISTPEDAALLHKYECIASGLGNPECAARLFNHLRKDATIDFHSCYLSGVFKDMKEHCDSRWNKWRAKLMRDYFSNPWSILSLMAALVLIFVTVILALLAVFASVRPLYYY